MRKGILLFCFVFASLSFAQVTADKRRLIKDGKTYRFKEYKQVFQNTEARRYFAQARTSSTIGVVLGTLGGAFVGAGLVQVIVQGSEKPHYFNGTQVETKPNWAPVWIGVGLIGVGFAATWSANKKAKKALNIENEGVGTAFQPHFKMEVGGNGIALSYNF